MSIEPKYQYLGASPDGVINWKCCGRILLDRYITFPQIFQRLSAFCPFLHPTCYQSVCLRMATQFTCTCRRDDFIIAMTKYQCNSCQENIKTFISADLDEYDSLCLLFCRGKISGRTVYIITHIEYIIAKCLFADLQPLCIATD